MKPNIELEMSSIKAKMLETDVQEVNQKNL